MRSYMSLLREIQRRIDDVDLSMVVPAPEGELLKGDKVVGVANELAKRIFIVWHRYSQEWEEEKVIASLKKRKSAGVRERVILKAETARFLEDMFWLEIKRAFPVVISADSIVLLSRWRVAVAPISHVLSGLFRPTHFNKK